MKKRSLAEYIFLIYFTIFFIIGVVLLVLKKLTAIDAFTAAAFYAIFFLISLKFPIRPFTAFIAGFIFAPHSLGIIGLYNVSKYDLIVHVLSSFFATIMIMDFSANKEYSLRKLFISAFIAVSIVNSFGAVVEMSEYWGFRLVGFGEGYLGFGEGDNSQNFGPWENSSLDLTFNLIGSLSAVFLYLLIYIKEPLKRKGSEHS